VLRDSLRERYGDRLRKIDAGIERDGRGAAEKQAVEVLDGPRLWPLLQPYLPADIEARVRASARHEALRRIAIAALGSATLGLLVGLGLQGLHVEEATPVAAAPVVATPSAAPSAAPAPIEAVPAVAPAPTPAVAPATDLPLNGRHFLR